MTDCCWISHNDCHRGQNAARKTLRQVIGLFSFLSLLLLPGPAAACSLSLVLAMDGSASVDAREHTLQLNGLADALRDPDVVQAIEAVGGIWVSNGAAGTSNCSSLGGAIFPMRKALRMRPKPCDAHHEATPNFQPPSVMHSAMRQP